MKLQGLEETKKKKKKKTKKKKKEKKKKNKKKKKKKKKKEHAPVLSPKSYLEVRKSNSGATSLCSCDDLLVSAGVAV